MKIVVLILATASICACTNQSNVPEQADNTLSNAERPAVSSSIETLEDSISPQADSQYLFLECSSKTKENFIFYYRIQENKEISSFDSSKNDYVYDNIIYYNEVIRQFKWYRSDVSRDLANILFEKNEDYYNVYANIIQNATFDDPDVLNSIYKMPIFSINRKTGEMSSASYIVANCQISSNKVSNENKF